jgi:hypothetical protein
MPSGGTSPIVLMWKRPSTIRTFSIAPSAPGIP